jgi:hypothetical protein
MAQIAYNIDEARAPAQIGRPAPALNPTTNVK